jgi:hypothetical protein
LEHFIVKYLIECVLDIDYVLQRRLRYAVPDFDELWRDPANRLRRGEVIIGPLRHYAVAIMLGGMFGLIVTFVGLFASADAWHPQRGQAPFSKTEVLFTGLVAVPLLVFALFWHFLRGGEMIIRPEGVVLRYRKTKVFCPWTLFQEEGKPWKRDMSRWVLPTWPPAVAGVVQGRGNVVIATGRAVRTSPFYFRTDGQVTLRNLYAVRLEELAVLLSLLGKKLGPRLPMTPPPEIGDPLPAEME